MTTHSRAWAAMLPALAAGICLQMLATQVSAQAAAQTAAPPQPRAGGMGSPVDPRVQQKTYRFTDTNEDLPYSVFVSSKVKPGEKAPLIVMLHGMGATHSFMLRDSALDQAEAGGYILVGPQGYNTNGWYGAEFPPGRGPGETPPAAAAPSPGATPARGPGPGAGAAGGPPRSSLPPTPPNIRELSEKDVMNVLALIRKDHNIDDKRIYLMGHSMGGAGTLHLVTKYPDIWAAAAVIAPAALRQEPATIRSNPDLPLLFVHGLQDNVVAASVSQNWAAHLKQTGHEFQYIELPEAGHGLDVITAGYEHMFPFFAKYRRK